MTWFFYGLVGRHEKTDHKEGISHSSLHGDWWRVHADSMH